MKQARIFIENLPETASESEIKSKFSNFGEVVSIEIKERKVVTIKHTSCFFAYVNLRTTDEKLQKCFQTFSEESWHGQIVKLQIAKESFLERLKREREAKALNNNGEEVTTITSSNEVLQPVEAVAVPKRKKEKIPKVIQEEKKIKKELVPSKPSDNDETTEKKEMFNEPINQDIDEIMLEVKRPRKESKIVDGLLKIENFGKRPIGETMLDDKKKVLDERQAESEAKRKKAVREKIKAYHEQKKKFDMFKTRPKIIKFNDDDFQTEGTDERKKNLKKVDIFESSESESEEMDLKSCIENRIKSDERFTLDQRFQDEQDEDDGGDINVIEEKNNLKILGEVLGKNIKTKNDSKEKKSYVRYDPDNPSHNKYVIDEKKEYKSKKTRTNDKEAVLKNAPEVSKERVYTQDVDFKSLLGKNEGFSLSGILNIENTVNEKEKTDVEEIPLPKRQSLNKNPFKYDSSDDEGNIEENKEDKKPSKLERPKKVWTEPLFLQDNDFRYQEGMDFVKKMATLKREEGQIKEEREKFIQIVKNKIRNVNKKDKRFKKKLGGSKKKKIKRINKAINR